MVLLWTISNLPTSFSSCWHQDKHYSNSSYQGRMQKEYNLFNSLWCYLLHPWQSLHWPFWQNSFRSLWGSADCLPILQLIFQPQLPKGEPFLNEEGLRSMSLNTSFMLGYMWKIHSLSCTRSSSNAKKAWPTSIHFQIISKGTASSCTDNTIINKHKADKQFLQNTLS